MKNHRHVAKTKIYTNKLIHMQKTKLLTLDFTLFSIEYHQS